MSLKAKGLLSLMLSLPDNWQFNLNGLISLSRDSKCSLKNALDELELFGHLKRYQERDANGRFSTVYEVYEIPQNNNNNATNLSMEVPHTEEPPAGKAALEKRPLSNTYHKTTNKSMTEERERLARAQDGERGIPSSIQEVEAFCRERNSRVDSQRFFSYYQARGWAGISDWRALFIAWEGLEQRFAPSDNSCHSFDTDDFFKAALKKSYGEAPITT